ncbi:MAG: BMP family ABC transporter substrate-binding protein [Nitrospinota bacterium]
MKKFIPRAVCLFAALALGLAWPSVGAAQKKKIRVAVMLFGPIGDAGWTFQHNQARLALEKAPYVSELKYAENVPQADVRRVLRNFAKQKFDLIIGTAFNWTDDFIAVSRRYKNVAFEDAAAYKTGKNMGAFFGRMYEVSYLTGMTAGAMTKTNKIGYVAAHSIPLVLRNVNAFAPRAKVHVIFNNTWYDPAKEAEAGKALLAQGVDVVAQWQDSPAAQQAAESAGKYSIGHNAPMHKFAPKGHLTDTVYNWFTFYGWAAQQVANGSWKATNKWWGLKENAVDIAPFGAPVPQKVRDRVLAMKAKIKSGQFYPFNGPIKDQSGRVVVAAGSRASGGDLWKVDYLVDNVVGQLPKKR